MKSILVFISLTLLSLSSILLMVQTTPLIANNASNKLESVSNMNNLLLGRQDKFIIQPLNTHETPKLESERLTSKIFSFYDMFQDKFVKNFKEIEPIVDTIDESEKFGNNGDRFDSISRGLIKSYESFSVFLNTIIEKPKEIVRTILKDASNRLDIIGSKLVGL